MEKEFDVVNLLEDPKLKDILGINGTKESPDILSSKIEEKMAAIYQELFDITQKLEVNLYADDYVELMRLKDGLKNDFDILTSAYTTTDVGKKFINQFIPEENSLVPVGEISRKGRKL